MFAQTAILWPAIALVALTFAVWFRLVFERLRHMKAKPPKPSDFTTGAAAMRYFEPVEMPANNLRNLTEMPLLFYAAIALLFATALAGTAQVVLASLYVALRAGHSFAHVLTRKVGLRFGFYLGSCAVLLAMWIGFAVDLARIG